jgi:hypothetical protein
MTEIVEVIMTQFSMIIKAPGQTAQPGRACKPVSRELPLISCAPHGTLTG